MDVEITWRGRNKLSYYRLNGWDVKSISKELNAGTEWGKYKLHIQYKYSMDSGNKMTKVDLKVKSSITMPSGSWYSSQSQKVKDNWDEIYKDLKKHEMDHAKIFESGLMQLQVQIESHDDLTVKELQLMVNRQTTQSQKDSDRYDSKTDHGRRDVVRLEVEN